MKVFTWQMAEELALGHMRAIGFTDARRAAPGPDGGLDVLASGAGAQVKHLSVPAGAPLVQQLRGATHHLENALFYSRSGFTASAVRFAGEHGVALFEYDDFGDVTAANPVAAGLEGDSVDWLAIATMPDDQVRREVIEPAQRARIFAEMTAINAAVEPLVRESSFLAERKSEAVLAARLAEAEAREPMRAANAHISRGIRLLQRHLEIWSESSTADLGRLWELLADSRAVLSELADNAESEAPQLDFGVLLVAEHEKQARKGA